MYKSYFGLKDNPFNVNPDPRYLFLTKEIEEALLEGVGNVICQELRLVLRPLEMEVEFEQRDGIALPQFRVAAGTSQAGEGTS